MLAKAEEQVKPYKEIDMLLASRQMEPEDFQQLRMEAKQAEDNLKFLTEEADAFYGDIQKQQQAAHQEAAQQCVKTLQDEMPEWSNQLYNDIRGYAVSIGLPQEQVDQYTDPVVIQLINKARLYDEGKEGGDRQENESSNRQEGPAFEEGSRSESIEEGQSRQGSPRHDR